MRERITKRVLREARIDEQVETAVAAIEMPRDQLTREAIAKRLEANPTDSWRGCVDEVVDDLIKPEQAPPN